MTPHHHDSEQFVIGAMMLSPKVAEDALSLLTADDFYTPRNRELFSTIRTMVDAGTDTSMEVVGTRLPDLRQYIVEIVSLVTNVRAWKAHGDIIRDDSTRRKLLDAAESIAQMASADDLDGACADAVRAVTLTNRNAVKTRTIAELFAGMDLTAKTEYLHTELFPATHLHRGDLLVLASRPAVGKSAAACQIADELASRHVRTRIYSYEMSAEDYTRRFIHRRAEFNRMKQDDGLSEADEEKARYMMAGDWSRFIEVDDSSPPIHELVRQIHRFAKDGGMLVVIDHLQILVEADYKAVSEASRLLKQAANDPRLNSEASDKRPVICLLSQLSRGSVREDGSLRPPALGDLRQSGSIEQDADAVALLHHFDDTRDMKVREGLENAGYLLEFDGAKGGTTQKTLSQIELAKNRHGKKATYPAWWSGDHQVWSFIDQLSDGRRL